MALDVEVTHRLGAFALSARFRAEPGLTALFGHSGSGKTSLINIIAGLIRPDRGRVSVNGEVLVDTGQRLFVARHRRRIGYVFQEPRLFPHLSVRRNLLYGRRFAPAEASAPRLEDVVGLLGIGHLLQRRPEKLSGGERQRVAIGRALLAGPRLLLMDEPLAAVDVARREEILPYIERLRDESRIPIVYVSHALSEVARLANTVVLLADGRVEAVGPVNDILSRLDLVAVTGAEDAGAVIEAQVADHEDGYRLSRLVCAAGELRVPRLEHPPGSAVRLRVRARDVIVATRRPEGLSALNVLPGVISQIAETDDGAEVLIDCNGVRLIAGLTRRSRDTLALRVGTPVFAIVKTVALDRDSFGRAPIARRSAGDLADT